MRLHRPLTALLTGIAIVTAGGTLTACGDSAGDSGQDQQQDQDDDQEDQEDQEDDD